MKTTRKNNPVVTGALLCILAATLYFIAKQMGGGDTPAVVITPVADTAADSVPKMTAAAASRGDQRDPFDHPALHRITKDGTGGQNLTSGAQAAQGTRMTPPEGKVPVPSANNQAIPGLPILSGQTQFPAAGPVNPAPGATVPTGAKPTASGADAPAQQAEDPLKGWRLTAIIAGRYPRAVIEGAGTRPYRVGVGERVGALTVTAIQEGEIVLCDARNLYTLPLTASPLIMENREDSSKDNSKDSKDAPVETTTNTMRENENGTAKIHP